MDFKDISKLAVLLSKNPPPPPNHKGITIIESKIIYKVTQKLSGSWLLTVGLNQKWVELSSCDVRPLPSFLSNPAEQIYDVKQIGYGREIGGFDLW